MIGCSAAMGGSCEGTLIYLAVSFLDPFIITERTAGLGTAVKVPSYNAFFESCKLASRTSKACERMSRRTLAEHSSRVHTQNLCGI